MKKLHLYLLLGIVVFATGCPKYKPKVDFDRNANTFVNKLNVFINAKHQDYLRTLGNNQDAAKRARNEAIEEVLPYIDSAYMDYITDLQAGRDRTNFVADLIELGGSAAVGIVNGERPLQIIGVGLTAIRGGRRSADLNFYKEQTVPVLINKMDGNRAKVRATILIREKDPVDTYTFGAAISDIVDYYNAGTLVRAFTELQKDTAISTRQAEEDVLVLKGVPLTRPSTEAETKEAQDILPVLESLNNSLAVASEQAAALQKLQNIVAALEKEPDVLPLLKAANISSTDTDGKKLLQGLVRAKRSIPPDSEINRKINQAIIVNGK